MEENINELESAASTIRSAINTARRNLQWTNEIKPELTVWFTSTFSGANSLTGGIITLVLVFITAIVVF